MKRPLNQTDLATSNGTTKHIKAAASNGAESTAARSTTASSDGRKSDENPNYDYLRTINKAVIDFDFEKTCSVTLANIRVYACLVCGKFFQGRAQNSVAYQHSIDQDHHVFINLSTGKVYLLPEDQEVQTSNSLLDDIRYNLNPKFNDSDIQRLHKDLLTRYDLNNNAYTVGYVGLNNVKHTDYYNVIIQVLSHVTPLKDFFLQDPELKDDLAKRFGLLVRRIWSMRAFKSHVSPHDFIQLVPSDIRTPVKALVWLLNSLKVPVVKECFQGSLLSTSVPFTSGSNPENGKVEFLKQPEKTKKTKVKFWMLSLTLPIVNENSQNRIPEVGLAALLEKFNGTKEVLSNNTATTLQILSAPKYIFLNIVRDVEGNHRGNPTVVNFPLQMDFAPHIKGAKAPVNYKLIANVSRKYIAGSALDHSDDKQEFSVSLEQGGQWHNYHDLAITRVDPELLFLEESILQVWKRSDID